MAKSVTNVMRDVAPYKRYTGMTMEEIQAELQLAGYGPAKAKRRAIELRESAQIQTDGRKNDRGEYIFFFVGWVEAYTEAKIDLDITRVGAVEWVDSRKGEIKRLDGGRQVWLLA